MQSADILGNRSTPRNRQRQKQGVQPCIVEPLSDVSAGCQQHSILVFWYDSQARDDGMNLLLAHAAAKYDEVMDAG